MGWFNNKGSDYIQRVKVFKMDILNSQIVLILFSLTLFAIDQQYVVLIYMSTIISCILKLIDKYMKQTNCDYHFDIFFLFNSSCLHYYPFKQDINAVLITYASFFIASIWMFSIVEFYAYEINVESREFIFLHVTAPLFLLTVFMAWWDGNRNDLGFIAVSHIVKFLYILHLYYYRKSSGFYNDFLVQLGGGEHVLQKNIAYHMVNYQIKIVALSFIICPLFLTNVPIIVLIIMFGFATTSMWLYVALKDAYFVYKTRENTTMEEEEILRSEIDAKI